MRFLRQRPGEFDEPRSGFAVLDVETTGLFPGRHDRVIEIGIVRCDQFGRTEDEYATLVNPGRDLGPTVIHGVRARDVVAAPSFGEILGDVCERLRGRVLVAHNARFDRDFLASEFRHAGVELPTAPWLCTMELGATVTGVRRLSACCAALNIGVPVTHRASEDAIAAAHLLAACLGGDETRTMVSRILALPMPPSDAWPTTPPSHRVASRNEGPPRRETYVTSLLDRLEPVTIAGDGAGPAYLALLDRALEDRLLTADEADGLTELAVSWGLGRDECRSLHDGYMEALVAAAKQDGVVTDAERADLEDVAALLQIEESMLDAMLAAPFVDEPPARLSVQARECLAGLSVCFTGQLSCTRGGHPITREDAEALAEAHGLVVKQAVTKKLDLLVVADPDSLSGKARKAREYGTRIMVERSFWHLIDVGFD